MKFDDILHEIGDFGEYQRRIYAIVCILCMPSAMVTLMHVFATAPTDHWCKVPGWNTSLCEGQTEGLYHCDETTKKLVTVPLVEKSNGSDASGEPEFQKCARYNVTDFSPLFKIEQIVTNGTHDVSYHQLTDKWSRDVIPCDNGWDYDRSEFTLTVVQENDLVCGREELVQYAQSVYYVGYLVGSVVFGTLADRHGRYPILMVTLVMHVVCGYAHLLFKSYWAYIVLRFFQGTVNISRFVIAYVVGTEFVGPSRRNISGALSWVPSATGHMILAGLAYFIRDWRMLVIAVTTPQILLFLCMIYLPESPRWLISQGKMEKAKKIIRKAAKVNGVTLPEEVLSDHSLLEEKAEKEERETVKYTPIELFRHRNICRRTLIAMYIWAVCAASYHGFNLSTSTLGVNVFISFMVSGAMEIAAVFFTMFVVELPWFGRRRSIIISLLLSGGSCLMTIFINPGPIRATVGMVGKFATTCAFVIIYLLTVELNPTPIRNIAMGFCSMISRVGGILAPLTLLTRHYWEPAPLVIFGSTLVLGGLLALFLPETIGRRMPETIEDGENYGRMAYRADDTDTKEIHQLDDMKKAKEGENKL